MIDQDILLLEQLGVLDQRQDLAKEGDGLLVELLGIADICRDDMVEGQISVTLGQLGPELFRLDGELTTDSVLRRADIGVDVVDGQPHGGILVFTGSREMSRVVLVKYWRGMEAWGIFICETSTVSVSVEKNPTTEIGRSDDG